MENKCGWLKFGFNHCVFCNYDNCECLSEDDKKRVYHMEEYFSGRDGDRD